jgi:hypothetical protein
MSPSSALLLTLAILSLPSVASATCMPAREIVRFVQADCKPSPFDGKGRLLLSSKLPVTFTAATGYMCCAGPGTCSSHHTPLTPAALIAQLLSPNAEQVSGVLVRLLRMSPVAYSAHRGVRETGIVCDGLPLLEMTGGPLAAGEEKLGPYGVVSITAGAQSTAAVTSQRALLNAAKAGPPSLFILPPPPPLMSVEEALAYVRHHEPALSLSRHMRLHVAPLLSGAALPTTPDALAPLLPVRLTLRAEDAAPEQLLDLVINRRNGAIYLKRADAFPEVAAAGGLFDEGSQISARTWASLYLIVAGEGAPQYYVDRDGADASVKPATLVRHSADHATLSACYRAAPGFDSGKTQCIALELHRPVE